jgi:hypothetical protein
MVEAVASSRGTRGNPEPARADQQLRLDRRGAERTRARGQGVATFVDPDGRLWLTRVNLLDRSDAGLGVRAPVPVSAGATFTLSIGGAPAVARGVVAHCRARRGTYRLGLHCAPRLAA